MAFDEIIFRRPDLNSKKINLWLDEIGYRPVLRFYHSSEPWMSVGCSSREISKGDEGGLQSCRRLTGGGIVHHGTDLIFSLIALKGHDVSFGSVRMSYLKIHEAVQKGFQSLGYETVFYRCDENLPRGKDCFRFPVATDLAFRGGKIAGGAQKRAKDRFLHQESVHRPEKLDWQLLQEAIMSGMQSVFGVGLEKYPLIPEIIQEASRLADDKYATISTKRTLPVAV